MIITIPGGSGGGSGTVTNTGGALTSNALVLGAGGNDTKVSTTLVTDGSHTITAGGTGAGSGIISLGGNTSGNATLTAPAVAGTTTNPVVSSNNIQAPAFQQTTNGSGGLLSSAGTGQALWSNNSILQLVSAGVNSMQLSNAGITFQTGKGQHINTQASNNDLGGTFSVSASTTGSVTFTTNYTSTPVVILTPQTTGLTSWFLSAVSNSGFTVTVAPSGTYTFGYHVIGNPN